MVKKKKRSTERIVDGTIRYVGKTKYFLIKFKDVYTDKERWEVFSKNSKIRKFKTLDKALQYIKKLKKKKK